MKSIFDAANIIYGQKREAQNRQGYEVFLAQQTLTLPEQAKPEGVRPMLRAEEVPNILENRPPSDNTSKAAVAQFLRRFNNGEGQGDTLSRNSGFDNSAEITTEHGQLVFTDEVFTNTNQLDNLNLLWESLSARKNEGRRPLTEVDEELLYELTRFRAMRTGS